MSQNHDVSGNGSVNIDDGANSFERTWEAARQWDENLDTELIVIKSGKTLGGRLVDLG
jgi:hypothetical protein